MKRGPRAQEPVAGGQHIMAALKRGMARIQSPISLDSQTQPEQQSEDIVLWKPGAADSIPPEPEEDNPPPPSKNKNNGEHGNGGRHLLGGRREGPEGQVQRSPEPSGLDWPARGLNVEQRMNI